MLIDVHAHAFHPKIAHKVLARLQDHYDIPPAGTGLAEDLLQRVRSAGLDKVVVLGAATEPAQVIPANNWALSLQKEHPEIIAFGTLHPAYDKWEKELERLKRTGIKGLKFHPEFQGFRQDDPALLPIIEAAQKDFIFLFHVGDRPQPADNPSCPYKTAAILDAFPDARIIAAHLGGYLHWPWALDALIGRDVFIDTSSSLPFMDDDTLRTIFRKHDPRRILFGSDYPLFDPAVERRRLQSRLNLTDSDLEIILSNAGRYLFT